MLENLARIQRRLGGEKYNQVKQCFECALNEFFLSQKVDGFHDGIKMLLTDYYDPMYRYQLASKSALVIFEGPEKEYLEWAENRLSNFQAG